MVSWMRWVSIVAPHGHLIKELGFCDGFLSTKIRGAGIAASIPAPIRASMRTARRRPSIRARADFEGAWQRFLSKRTEADFQEWRDERDWTARKYAMWETLRS
jgi:hypothetical protein